jgi:hypothetical protein
MSLGSHSLLSSHHRIHLRSLMTELLFDLARTPPITERTIRRTCALMNQVHNRKNVYSYLYSEGYIFSYLPLLHDLHGAVVATANGAPPFVPLHPLI